MGIPEVVSFCFENLLAAEGNLVINTFLLVMTTYLFSQVLHGVFEVVSFSGLS